MNPYYKDIVAFHTKFELTPYMRSAVPKELIKFRHKFLMEEITELQFAISNGDMLETLDALVDIAYVAIGTIYLIHEDHGPTIPFEPSFDEVGYLQKLKDPSIGIEMTRCVTQFLIGAMNLQYSNSVSILSLQQLLQYIEVYSSRANLPFKEAWNEVQSANMRKERAQHASQSKRGSAFDIIKPEGWVGPNLHAILWYYDGEHRE